MLVSDDATRGSTRQKTRAVEFHEMRGRAANGWNATVFSSMRLNRCDYSLSVGNLTTLRRAIAVSEGSED
jgi:hypothetical protein